MSWNYRILATEVSGEVYFLIHDVYYNENDIPDGYSENACIIGSESTDGIKNTLDKMEIGSKKGILWGGDRFPEPYRL